MTGIAVTLGAVMAALVLTGGGCRSPAARERPRAAASPGPQGPTLPVIARGENLDLKQHTVKGKITIFAFYSDSSPACRMLDPDLDRLAAQRPDIALVKIDVDRPDVRGSIQRDSPVMRRYQIEALPHLVIFDWEGQQLASGEEALEKVAEWLKG